MDARPDSGAVSVGSIPMGRPLFVLTVSLALGIAVQHAWPISFPESPAVICLAILTLPLVFGAFGGPALFRHPALPLTIFFGLGLLLSRTAAPELPAPPLLTGFFDRPQTLYLAEVASPPEFYPDRIQLPLRLHSALKDGAFVRVEGQALVSLNKVKTAPAAWLAGDMLLGRITLKPLHNFNNPGGYDYVRAQAERGIYARAYLSDDRFLLKVKPPQEPFPLAWFRSARAGLDLFRQQALHWLRTNLDPDTAAFYAALLLGYQRLLSPAWQEHLARTGVSHLLSIGGMHLGFFSMAVFWLVRFLVRIFHPSILHRTSDRMLALWPALAAAILYAFIAGFSAPPIWRSTLMLTLCLTAACSYRSPDQLSVLAAAALVILAADPNSLQQISFQLTFACMLAIFTLYPRSRRFHLTESLPVLRRSPILSRVLHPFEEAFWVSIAVNVLVLPLTIHYFHGISLAGLAANIVLVPAVGFAVLPAGLLSIALYAVDERLAAPVLALGGWCLRCCEAVILWFSSLSWAFFWVGEMPVYCLFFIYAALALGIGPWRPKTKAVGLTAVILLFAVGTLVKHGLPQSNAGARLEVTAIDVGQGSSILVKLPRGETFLVDGGGFFDDSFDVGRAVLAPFLWHSGIRGLDYVVLTHDHPDHRNGLRFILSHFRVAHFWESGISENKRKTASLAEIARKRGIPRSEITELFGERTFGPCSVRIVHPSSDYLRNAWDGKDLNDVSLVMAVTYGNTRLILPGDTGASVERRFSQGGSFSGSSVPVSPHHGSDRSNSPLLLDRVRPETVIFFCGPDNAFGFPHASVLEELRRRNIAHCRTDLDGAVHAASDGRKWTITTETARAATSQRIDRGGSIMTRNQP